MRAAYFDCFAGASGDMILGALLDAGLALEALRAELAKLPLSGYSISATREKRGGLSGTRAAVALEGPPPGPRSLGDILALLTQSRLTPRVREGAARAFTALAQAEARAHGTSLEAVHLHEVGAVDALVDVAGSLAGLELLGVERVYCSPLPAGAGLVKSAHGLLPVPAPATLELLAQAGAPLQPAPDVQAEVLTPTAAAILTTLATFHRPSLALERVGYGVGARDLGPLPNLLRVWIGGESELQEEMLLLETNIDDMSPQVYGYVMERLLEEGAADVWFTPIQMKKSRPAAMISVLAPRWAEAALTDILFRETSTLGLRLRPVERHEAMREVVALATSLGQARVKVKRLEGRPLSLAPEYEDCRRLARQHHLPLQEVYRRVEAEARAQLWEGETL